MGTTSDAGDDPTVSVVLPVYDAESYVEEAVESVLGQTYDDFELLVVHRPHAADDRTEELLEPYLRDERVVYRRQVDAGYAEGINQGIEAATGRYVCFQDADDVSLPTRLEKEVAVLDAHPNVHLVFSQAWFLDDDGERDDRWSEVPAGVLPAEEAFYRLYLHGNFVPNPSVMFRNDGARRFNEDLETCADYEHHLHVAHEADLYAIGEPLVEMRRGDAHEHMTTRYEQNLADGRRIIRLIRRRYREAEPRVTRRHYRRAMSNRYLQDANYRLPNPASLRGLGLALAYDPTNERIYDSLSSLVAGVS
ncbi:glycosyltransferase [Candidatus Halobonum tyrrellensis]|uniref:Putative glycosyltransferase n=1 Tax=Candidatus Halobonum tyrrellensis G22 TaxID=1324957 RepID=V4GXZ1_9EURY|nr:glycosyltransferase [Candidatus Halobonum tyrrellensis]ESP90036.1 putative glycosyltransferase [Candidatus Halobonum tyrrellensis G22]